MNAPNRSFIAIPSTVAENATLSPADKLVYGAMLGYQGRFYHCFASLDKIAIRCGVNEKTVRRSITSLVKTGAVEPVIVNTYMDGKPIQFQQRGGGLGGKTKSWRCLIPISKTRKLQVISSTRSAG